MVHYVNLHTHHELDNQQTGVVNAEMGSVFKEGSLYSFGLHPWEIVKIDPAPILNKLEPLIVAKKIIAVGEIGIDRAINVPLDIQQELFRHQHQLATTYHLPVIIHCVKAYSDFLQLHNQLNPRVPWIFHGFTGNKITAKQLTNLGCYLSFGERLLNQTKIQEALKQIPLQKIFFETDTSVKPIESIYAKASELLQIDLEELKNIVSANFKTVFLRP